jgi:hypothetical protein
MTTLKYSLAIFVAALSMTVWAGSKGFTVVLMEIGGQGFYESRTYGALLDGFPDSQVSRDCWSARATGGKDFETMVRKAIPAGLTTNMAKSIWVGDQKAAKSAQQIMAKAIAPNRQHIDGLYVIDARDGRISVMTLGTKAPLGSKNPSRKLTIPWTEDNPVQGAADFNLALCRVSRPLDYQFFP